jgi:nucleotide-binding universal stress UspA family protein
MMPPIRTILHPTDFSPSADYAFQMARALARTCNARLVVLHVAAPPPIVTPTGVVTQAKYQDYKDELLQNLRQRTAGGEAVSVEHRVEEGDVVEEILRVARAVGADLIVLGTHGWTGLGRLLIGSVAEKVLRASPVPVITVKAPRADQPPA